jgi:hypothetical protein
MKLSKVGRNRKYIAGMSIFWTALAYWFAISVAFEDVSRRPLLPFQLVVLAIGGSLQVWGLIEAAKTSSTTAETITDIS